MVSCGAVSITCKARLVYAYMTRPENSKHITPRSPFYGSRISPCLRVHQACTVELHFPFEYSRPFKRRNQALCSYPSVMTRSADARPVEEGALSVSARGCGIHKVSRTNKSRQKTVCEWRSLNFLYHLSGTATDLQGEEHLRGWRVGLRTEMVGLHPWVRGSQMEDLSNVRQKAGL